MAKDLEYPFRHLNGARAMAQHVSEGGNPYDDLVSILFH